MTAALSAFACPRKARRFGTGWTPCLSAINPCWKTAAFTVEQIDAATGALTDLERFWMQAATMAPRAPEPLIGKAVDRSAANAYFQAD